jgi:molybdenum cofactor cytidylyltransferase
MHMKKGPIAGIVLAAGEAKRFGGCKQLAKLQGRPLVQWVLDAALASDLDEVVLVLGSRHRQVLETLGLGAAHPRLRVVVNPEFAFGQSTSLRAGLKEIGTACSAVMFLLADQPFVTPVVINLLLERYRRSDRLITLPVYRERRGNPCILARAFYADIRRITGDKGAREIIANHPAEVLEVEIPDPAVLMDVDLPADLDRLNRDPKWTK